MSVDVTKLPSGLTVVTDSMPHLETAALGVWAGVGGRDEKPNEHGISHLLEHMAFKGTGKRSAWEIASDIENVGGEINAATSIEYTSYTARVLGENAQHVECLSIGNECRGRQAPLVQQHIEIRAHQLLVGMRGSRAFRHALWHYNLAASAPAVSSPMRRRNSVPISG